MAKQKLPSDPHWFPFEWSKAEQPILVPSPSHFVSRNIYEPSVLFDGQTHLLMFRGESRQEIPTTCVGRLGVGMSEDGRQFHCQPQPALVPDSPYEAYGLAHPRLNLAGGVFMLTYAAFDGARYRLCLATSSDFKTWFRHGPLFPEFEENDGNIMSGVIMPHHTPGGKYFMYVGAGDLWLASSNDLVNWQMEKKPVLKRKDCADFACKSIDPGPSPFLAKDGIVAILNGTDKKNHVRSFAALFDAKKPGKCLASLKSPFLEAEHDWERFGYLPNVVRATGLSLIDNTLHLYYSGADRCVGLARAPVPKDYLIDLEGEATVETKASAKKKKTKKKKKDKVCGV